MTLYIFGNGNTSFEDFQKYYGTHMAQWVAVPGHECILCDFRGIDTLAMEFLKTKTANVTVYHVGERPRYFPDSFRTRSGEWTLQGGYANDAARDQAAIAACTHFLAIDFNSDANRKSGTQKNIERCLALGKIRLE